MILALLTTLIKCCKPEVYSAQTNKNKPESIPQWENIHTEENTQKYKAIKRTVSATLDTNKQEAAAHTQSQRKKGSTLHIRAELNIQENSKLWSNIFGKNLKNFHLSAAAAAAKILYSFCVPAQT